MINIEEIPIEENLETLTVKIQVDQNKAFLVTVLYKNPSAPASTLDHIHSLLEHHARTNLNFYLVGDFNLDFRDKKNKHVSTCKKWLRKFKTTQLIEQPTRVTEKSSTTIDWAITNAKDMVRETKSIPTAISDHNLITVELLVKQPKQKPRKYVGRNWKQYSVNKLLAGLNQL